MTLHRSKAHIQALTRAKGARTTQAPTTYREALNYPQAELSIDLDLVSGRSESIAIECKQYFRTA